MPIQRFLGEDDCVHFRAGVQDVGGVLAILKLTTAFCNVFRYLHWRITLRGKFCVDETVCCLCLVMAALDRDFQFHGCHSQSAGGTLLVFGIPLVACMC